MVKVSHGALDFPLVAPEEKKKRLRNGIFLPDQEENDMAG